MAPRIAAAITWLLAPLAGLAAINLLTFLYLRLDGKYGPALDRHQGWAIVGAVLLAAWVGAIWLLARSRSGRARRNYLLVTCVLVVGGVAAGYAPYFMSGGTTAERIR
jgi:hypothetical protein